MLFQWIERWLGTAADFWSTVAPDPNFPRGGRPDELGPGDLVECLHCHRMTPSSTAAVGGDDRGVRRDATETPTAYVASASSSASLRKSPWMRTPTRRGVVEDNEALKARLWEAIVATASLSATANKNKMAIAEEIFNALRGMYNPDMYDDLAEIVKSNPRGLVDARVTKGEGEFESYEGYTPLHTACNRGYKWAVELMLNTEVAMELVQLTNLQGETALHLACARGHVDIAKRLKEFYERHGLDMLQKDILGLTPLASALTSADCSNANKTRLLELLLSPNDPCVYGEKIPPSDRSFYWPSLRVAVGISEMPGKRGAMEDATLVTLWAPSEAGGNKGAVAIAGVLDGHDEGGKCSQEAADRLQNLLFDLASNGLASDSLADDATAITDVFQRVDNEIRQDKSIPGGTTACIAIVTDQKLLVANVGDSRCVSVQRRVPDESLNVDANEPFEERMERLSLSSSESDTVLVNGTWYEVVPMSHDHKPNLKQEKNRIEAAGLKVIRDQEVHKVKSSWGSKLAMSRSLGDYDFKNNKDLTRDQQAVIATPEVATRKRSDYNEVLIVASDGVWDVMSNGEAAVFVAEELRQTNGDHVLAHVADLLCLRCFEIGSEDNISVVLVALGEMAERLAPAAAPKNCDSKLE